MSDPALDRTMLILIPGTPSHVSDPALDRTMLVPIPGDIQR
jgi:hypothetical protein